MYLTCSKMEAEGGKGKLVGMRRDPKAGSLVHSDGPCRCGHNFGFYSEGNGKGETTSGLWADK